MKKHLPRLLCAGLLAACAFTASAATITYTTNVTVIVPDAPVAAAPAVSTETAKEILSVVQSWWKTNDDQAVESKRYSVVAYGEMHTKLKEFGGGVFVSYAATENLGVGIGINALSGNFTMPSGNVTFRLPIKPLKWLGGSTNSFWQTFEATPAIFAGIAVPVSGAGKANGGAATLEGTFFETALWHPKLFGKPAELDLMGGVMKVQNAGDFSGTFGIGGLKLGIKL